jgi:hypothetical protein
LSSDVNKYKPLTGGALGVGGALGLAIAARCAITVGRCWLTL